MADPALKKTLVEGNKCVIAAGVYDLISALLADREGFDLLFASGYGMVASYMGLPDAGIATYRDMVERAGQIVERTKTPVLADGDTGYGGLLNVRHTVRGYEKAGVSAIQLEDQEFPKKCGHWAGRNVISMEDMVKKIQVASDSRSSSDFLIVGRTDSRTALGLDEALRRSEAYAKAGADVIFLEAPQTEAELEIIGRNLDVPLVANMVMGGKTPVVSLERLQEMGFRMALYSSTAFLSAGAALEAAYKDLKKNGTTTDKIPLISFNDFSNLMGMEDVLEFDQRYAG